ncbi:hypothetical protein ACVMB0_004853 [Bradyrhizobium sp. USDA 4451]
MLTVYGEGRGFRVVWLLEELGLAYRLRPVDLHEPNTCGKANISRDAEGRRRTGNDLVHVQRSRARIARPMIQSLSLSLRNGSSSVNCVTRCR